MSRDSVPVARVMHPSSFRFENRHTRFLGYVMRVASSSERLCRSLPWRKFLSARMVARMVFWSIAVSDVLCFQI